MFTKVKFSEIRCIVPDDAKWVCNNPDAEVLSVREYDSSSKAAQDCLYICNYSDFLNAPAKAIPNAIVVAPDADSMKQLKSKANLIVVPDKDALYRITTGVLTQLSALARLGSASYTLQSLSIGRAPLDNILKYAYQQIKLPAMLTDASLMVISHVGTDEIEDNKNWMYARENESLPIDAEPEDSDSIAITLSFKDKLVGHLFVLDSNGVLTDFDKEFIQLVANFAAQVIGHNDHKLLLNSSFNEDFLTSILSEAITSPEEILQKQETFGIKLDETLRIIVIDMPLAVMDSDTTQSFTRRLRLLFKRNCIVPYENAIVILMDTEDDDFFLSDSDFHAFEDLLNEFECKANVSAPFHYMYQIRRHYMQAMMCSTLRSMLHLDKPILGYHKEMAEYHMIFNYSMVQNLENLLHPAVIKLRKLDNAHGTDMLDTLFAYANHLCNLTATAKDLYLHYNTLKYRIDKIASLTNVDFDNSADVHRIVLSQRVIEIEEALNGM
ncbi:MAG: helix-turn-helix domain-containing protein [Clostridiales bacterium]|nr:helix-turn-helix domain-containing protein [Candidatus Crickella merdequi]